MTPVPVIPVESAARLFLGLQGLLDDPGKRLTCPSLQASVERLGFVQVDTIRACGRAHDLILHTRHDGYREGQVWELLDRHDCFEAFTHDASLVPTRWYPHWRPRWKRDDPRIRENAWWRNLLGDEADRVCAHVLERIAAEGALRSADFEHPEKRGPWWGWKPQKAALDYLWRTGRLAVAGRVNFQKRYDLPERIYPEAHAVPEPDVEAHRNWACGSAADRLGIFTPRELAAFWAHLDLDDAKAWCSLARREGRIVPVEVASADGAAPQPALALADWETRLTGLPEPQAGLRLLAPFDPVVRDRARLLRRFGFDYRFEAFVPEAKRTYGYYVLPILEGTRLVGRVEPRLSKDRRFLEVLGLWWEPGVKATKARQRTLDAALVRLADFLGVSVGPTPR